MISSGIYTGNVMHARHEPIEHVFKYPLYLYSFDIDDLPDFNKKYFWFGYNRKSAISIHDKDYLIEQDGSLKEKVFSLLEKFEYPHSGISKILLLTGARFFNYVFNPVSFFYCYNSLSELQYIIVEINNTFDERHVYILHKDDFFKFNKKAQLYNTIKEKSFHVSPFNDMEGDYDFHMSDIAKTLDIRINIIKSKKTVFNSRLWGERQEFTPFNVLKTVLVYPMSAVLSMPRILFQAAKLYYLKKLIVYKKPSPVSEFTIKKARPKLLQRLAMHYVLKFLSRIKKGQLRVILPSGEIKVFGDSTSSDAFEIKISNYDFFWKVFTSGAVGFGESYVEGYWETEDLTAFIGFLIENKSDLDERKIKASFYARIKNRLLHIFNSNTIRGSKKNISEHYDLSNAFYEIILDPSMTYSCAIYSEDNALNTGTIEDAQYNKIRKMLDKAMIRKGDHLLEIGSGWGSLAITAARDYDCKVTSITLSEEQLAYAREKAKQNNLSAAVNFTLCDYRKLRGKYDRIVSVEMLEAVGEEYLGNFFNVCDKVLAEEGIIVLQVITMPEQRYEIYRKGSDWIQKHIFPGATVPSLQVISDSIAKNSSLLIENVENIGPYYAPTLRFWRDNLEKNSDKIRELGFDERFMRKWYYYFSYCEAAFMTRTLNVLQLVLTRPNNKLLRQYDAETIESSNLNKVKIRA